MPDWISPAYWGRPARQAQRILFALAAFWALISIPLFVLQHTAGPSLFAGPGFAYHGREMLLGFLLPIVAGYLRPRLDRGWLAAFLLAWAAGRVSAFAGPDAARVLADALQGLVFAASVVPMLARGAKKWRNRALPVVLTLLAAFAGLFLVAASHDHGAYRPLLEILLVTLALLLLFMGGRILVPLFRGHAARNGMPRPPGLQPRIEGALIVLGFVTLVLVALGWRPLAAAGVWALGGLGLWRMMRWRPWRYSARPELLALLAGQVWTVAALGVLGLAWVDGRPAGGAAVHLVTIGGVGTMTSAVMSFVLLKEARRVWLPGAWLALNVSLMAASVAFRLAAEAGPSTAGPWLALSAACWSGAWLGVLILAVAGPRRRAGV